MKPVPCSPPPTEAASAFLTFKQYLLEEYPPLLPLRIAFLEAQPIEGSVQNQTPATPLGIPCAGFAVEWSCKPPAKTSHTTGIGMHTTQGDGSKLHLGDTQSLQLS